MGDTRDGWGKLQVLMGVVSALGSVAIPVVLFVVGNRIADRQRLAAERQLQADRVERMLAHLASEKANEKKLAVRVLEFFVSEEEFPRELLPALVEIASSDAKEDVSATASAVLQRVAQSDNAQAASEAKRGLSSLPPRINLHAPASQGRRTESALSGLSHSDVVVAPQDTVLDPPAQTQLRYYRKEDAVQARQMVQRLADSGIKAQPIDLSQSVGQQSIRPQSYDLVIGKDSPP